MATGSPARCYSLRRLLEMTSRCFPPKRLAHAQCDPYVCAVALQGAHAPAAQRFSASLMTLESHQLSGLFAERYLIERAVGRGASASVYLAHDKKQDREIALKVLDNELGHALGAQRFLQEIRITSRLQHPHILPTHDSGEWKGLLYYVLPFVSGESLRARLDREKQLPIDECVQLTCDVASALSHAHSKGVVHRDVKPENILLSDGHALIADFGIARTIEATSAERLTSSGLIVGTSQYMSPEQASGEREIDARSDIYSLGCVLYEMLAGVEPFTGPTVQAIIAQRFSHAPRPVQTYRTTVPDNLASALDKALAISPADRFQSMKEFAAALPASAPSPSERRRPGRVLRDFVRTRRGKVIGGATALALIVLAAAALPMRNGAASFFASTPSLDSSLFVVMPMAATSASTPGDLAAIDGVTRAMQRWHIPVVSDVALDEAIKRAGAPSAPTQAVDLARSLGAGRMIRFARTGENRIKLYDVQARSEISSATIASDDSAGIDRALMDLLRDPRRPSTADGGDGRTTSFAAWRMYGAGHIALKTWSLQKALAEFEAAALNDPSYIPARLWKAQLTMWVTQGDSITWARDAEFAAARSESLSPRDAALARGLNALAQRNYSAACTEYRTLATLDSLDFLGWFGLGECQSRDASVARSERSPSGWRFTASYRQASAAYLRAVRLDPGASIISYDQIRKMLAVSPNTARRGYDDRGNVAFAAYPSLENDTLAFIPYPLKVFSTMSPPATRSEALDRNARNIFEFATSWTRADPRNPSAFEELALILETRGEIASDNGARMSASEAVRKALALSTNVPQRIALATTEVRLRIKRHEFDAAARLADSLLSRQVVPPGGANLIALSAFAGKSERMAKEVSRSTTWMPQGGIKFNMPPNLISTGARLFARSALGMCGTETEAVQARLATELESYVNPDNRELARHRLSTRPSSMLAPCTGGKSSLLIPRPDAPLYRMQRAFADKNVRLVRAILDSVPIWRAHMRPGDVSLDQTYQEAWIKAAIGDTAAAAKQLDLALNALPTLSASALMEPAAAAALGRAMLLRAELAEKSHDRKTAQQWSAAVKQLWQHADPELRAACCRM